MRILFVTSNFPRWKGDSTTPFILNLAEDLAKLGWQIDVIAPHAKGAALSESFGHIRVFRFRYFFPESLQTLCYKGGALTNIRKNQLTLLLSPFLVASQIFNILRLSIKYRYSIIHAHWLIPQGFSSTLVSKLLGIPVVISVHGGDIFGLRGNFISWFKRFAIKHADAITANSKFTKNAIERLQNTKIQLVPMGVSVTPPSRAEQSKAKEIRQYYCPNGETLVLFLGRLVEEKGIDDLLHATFLVIKKQKRKIHLIIGGDGQDKDTFRELCRKLDICDHVSFANWIPQEEVKSFMIAADIFVLPSRTSLDGRVEAQGLTPLEAMASQTIVITTNIGGLGENVVNGKTGFTVNERSPKELANTICHIMDNRNETTKIIEYAYTVVKKQFSREATSRKFNLIYKSIQEINPKSQQNH